MAAESLFGKTIKKYLIDQRVFFKDPRAFVARVRPRLARSLRQPVTYLLGAGAAVLAVGQVNLNLYDQRITRVIVLPDLVMGQVAALASAGALAFGIYVVLNLVGGRVTLRESAGTTMYAIAFVLPVLTAVFIVATRISSFIASETILFVPPTRIVSMGTPQATWTGSFGIALVVSVEIGWNVYMLWLIWLLMRALSGLGAARTGLAISGVVLVVYSLSGWINAVAGPVVRVFKPVLENLLKG